MALSIFTPIFADVDQAILGYVSNTVASVSATATPFVAGALAVSFILFGMLIVIGEIDMPIESLVKKMAVTLLISGVATSGGLYQTQIVGAMLSAPDALANAVLSNPTPAGSAVDGVLQSGMAVSNALFSKMSVLSPSSYVLLFFGALIMVVTVVFAAVGAVVVLLVKVLMGLLAALGPLFIFALLFGPTRTFFYTWLGRVVAQVFLVVSFFSCFGMAINFINRYANAVVNSISSGSASNAAMSIGALATMMVAFIWLLKRLPDEVGQMVGSAAADYRSSLPKKNATPSQSSGGRDSAGGNSGGGWNSSSSSNQNMAATGTDGPGGRPAAMGLASKTASAVGTAAAVGSAAFRH